MAAANAQAASLEQLKQHWQSVAAGVATTIAIHELGHLAVAATENVDAEFNGLSIVYPEDDLSDRSHLRLASAGYQSQWLASEYAFHQLDKTPDSAKQRAFYQGMVLGHIGITAAYLTFLKNHDQGDSLGISEASSLSTDQVALSLAIPAALDSWRLFGTSPPRWVPMVSKSSKLAGVALVWTF